MTLTRTSTIAAEKSAHSASVLAGPLPAGFGGCSSDGMRTASAEPLSCWRCASSAVSSASSPEPDAGKACVSTSPRPKTAVLTWQSAKKQCDDEPKHASPGDRLEASLEDRLQHSFSAARTTRSAVPESGPQVVQEPRHPDGLDHDLAGATPGAPPFSGRLAALQP